MMIKQGLSEHRVGFEANNHILAEKRIVELKLAVK
jgi:hypothetical protein